MLKKRSSYSLFVLVLLILSGCVQFLAPPEPVTITFVHAPDDAAHYEALVEEFNKEYDHITVELAGWNEVFSGRLTEFDAFAMPQFQLSYLMDEDVFASLDPWIEQDKTIDMDDFYPGAVQAFQRDGQQWGLPFEINVMVMYYNKTLFDQKGVAYPEAGWTWEDFQARAIEVSDPDRGVFGYAYHESDNLAFFEPVMFMYQNGGRLFDNPLNPNRVILNDPQNVEALQWYADLINKYHVAPSMGGRAMPYPQSGIEQGHYAMWVDLLPDEQVPEWGVAPLPQGDVAATFGAFNALFIFTGTNSPDASWQWISFVSHQLPPHYLPARRSLAASEAYGKKVGSDVMRAARASVENIIPMGLNLGEALYQHWGNVMSTFERAMSKIRQGSPPQAVLDEAQKAVDF